MRNHLGLRGLLLLVGGTMTACATASTGPASLPAGAGGQGKAVVEGPRTKAPSQPHRSLAALDLRRDVLLSLVLPNIDEALSRLSRYVLPHLPRFPLIRRFVDPVLLRARFFRALRMPALATALDLRRPIAVCVLDDPRSRRLRTERQTLFALPVKDKKVVISQLASRFGHHRKAPGDVWQFQGRRGVTRLWVRFVGGWALLAPSERFARGAESVLLPLVRRRAGAGKAGNADEMARLALHVARGDKRFRGLLPMVGGRLHRRLRHMTRWLHGLSYFGLAASDLARHSHLLLDTRSIDLALDLGKKTLVLRGRLPSRGLGVVSMLATQMPAGRPWGLRWLPVEAPLVFVARRQPSERSAASRRGLARWRRLVGKPILGKVLEQAETRLSAVLGAAEAVALLSPRAGGVALVAAQRLRAKRNAARAASRELLRALARAAPELSRELLGVSAKARFRSTRRGGWVELRPRWPRRLAPPKRRVPIKRLALRSRVAFEAMFGKRPCVAQAVVTSASKDLALLTAAGAGCRKLLRATIARGSSRKPPTSASLAARVLRDSGGATASVLTWVELAALIEQVLPLAAATTSISPQVATLVRQLLPPPGAQKAMPLVASLRYAKHGTRFSLRLSADVMEMVTKVGMLLFSVGSYGSSSPRPAPPAPRPTP